MLIIDDKTLDICLSYGNTLDIEIYLDFADIIVTPIGGVDDGSGISSPTTQVPPDKIYVSIDDDGREVFGGLYDIYCVDTNEGEKYIWTFSLTHTQSLTIMPGDYTWDFTYYQKCIVTDGIPSSNGVVYTPFCEQSRARFKVQETGSTTFDTE